MKKLPQQKYNTLTKKKEIKNTARSTPPMLAKCCDYDIINAGCQNTAKYILLRVGISKLMNQKQSLKVAERGASMLKEFKAFALKGNVIDLAVAVIIGGAFGRIIASLVNDIIMPTIGVLLGGVSFADLKHVIAPAVGDIAEVAIRYGAFIQAIIDFVIIAFSVFLFIKLLSAAKKKAVEAPAAPSEEVVLLEQIRDLLKSK